MLIFSNLLSKVSKLFSFSLKLFWQLVYQLFTTTVTPGEEEVKIVMQMAEEAVRAQERDPYTAFANRVKELNYGNSYFFRVCMISNFKYHLVFQVLASSFNVLLGSAFAAD